MNKQKLPTINKNKTQLIFLLYKFRYCTIKQLQKYFNHKDPHRIKEWLNDLKDKKYISVISDKTDPTKPYVFCLATRAKYILQEDKNCDQVFLERLHKEKRRDEIFRNHLLFLFDIYLYFLSRQEKNVTLHFLTQQDLKRYDFFPKELPDAYISIETKEKTDKYFLELFDEYRDKPGIIRFTTRKYITFCENGNWQANTNNSLFPAVLFIVTNDRRKAFVAHYGKAKLNKTFESLSLFITTQDNIKFSNGKVNIWSVID